MQPSTQFLPKAYYESRVTKTHKVTLSPPPNKGNRSSVRTGGATPNEKKKLDTPNKDSPSRKQVPLSHSRHERRKNSD